MAEKEVLINGSRVKLSDINKHAGAKNTVADLKLKQEKSGVESDAVKEEVAKLNKAIKQFNEDKAAFEKEKVEFEAKSKGEVKTPKPAKKSKAKDSDEV